MLNLPQVLKALNDGALPFMLGLEPHAFLLFRMLFDEGDDRAHDLRDDVPLAADALLARRLMFVLHVDLQNTIVRAGVARRAAAARRRLHSPAGPKVSLPAISLSSRLGKTRLNGVCK